MATFKPGEVAPDSGELVEVGPRGGKVPNGRRTVIERGETVPPTSEKGNQFKYKNWWVEDDSTKEVATYPVRRMLDSGKPADFGVGLETLKIVSTKKGCG